MPTPSTDIMEAASQALAKMHYPQCEALCMKALRQAREQDDWQNYARILMPLQESRRLKRQTAIDHAILLGTAQQAQPVSQWLDPSDVGCIVVTRPHSAEDAAALVALAVETNRSIEVLWADVAATESHKTWTIHTMLAPAVNVAVSAPHPNWLNRWITKPTPGQPTPAHWFMQAFEALGDAGLESVKAPRGSRERIVELESVLAAVGDHEMLHQALGDAVRQRVVVK